MRNSSPYQIAGILAWHEGDLARSEALLSRAVELINEAGHLFAIGTLTCGHAIVLFELGRVEQAYESLNKARSIAKQSEFDYELFETDLFQAYFDFH